MSFSEITNILPHRYPFLLIDRIEKYEEDERIICIKNVTINESFFVGHFPEKPVMPGVLIVEAAAQAGILFFGKSNGLDSENEQEEYLLTSVKVNFIKSVVPGDTLWIEIIPIKLISSAGIFKFTCKVDEEIVSKGEFVFAVK